MTSPISTKIAPEQAIRLQRIVFMTLSENPQLLKEDAFDVYDHMVEHKIIKKIADIEELDCVLRLIRTDAEIISDRR